MFAALFDASGRRMPIDRLAIVASALPNPTQVFAAGANVAFIKSPTGEAADIDSCLKPPSGGPTGLIGRIRLDRRSTLRERLGAASGASDADLLIGAYERWGDDFLRHVRGDYCFVLVDSPRRRLIAARDQLGVRALFYARRGDLWLISDSLDWLAAQWPRRPDLDEYWIGDFLTLGHSREFRRTVYRDIHRVPPGHCLQLDERDNSLRRYWQLEIAEPLHLKHAGEYAERFRELMAEAISDRLPKGTVGIAMSGGIDSTSLAALSIELKKDASQVVAECIHYKRLMNVGEDRYARLEIGRAHV